MFVSIVSFSRTFFSCSFLPFILNQIYTLIWILTTCEQLHALMQARVHVVVFYHLHFTKPNIVLTLNNVFFSQPYNNDGLATRRGTKMAEGLSYSRSLTELTPADMSRRPDRQRVESERLSCSLPPSVLKDTLRRAKARQAREKGLIGHNNSDGEEGPSRASEEEAQSGQKSQQHKKLTLAQLYRIRTTLVLNSTLTAS